MDRPKTVHREAPTAFNAPRAAQAATGSSETVPLVSVVIPTFNRTKLLARALESVRRQTYINLDVIVVDDASPDETAAVVRMFDDPRLRYIRHETNRGGSAARNTGIRAARGDFIAFLDDDDEWAPRKTEEQLRALRDHDVVLCTSDAPAGGVGKYDGKSRVELEDLRRGLFTSGGTGVLMARAHVLKEICFDESLPRYQDWDLFIRIAQKHTICYLNKSFVRYNVGSHERITNKIANMPVADLEHQLKMVHKHKRFFGNKWFKRHMSRALLYGVKHRKDKIPHLRYVAGRYGAMNVGWAVAQRVAQKMAEGRRVKLGAARRIEQ